MIAVDGANLRVSASSLTNPPFFALGPVFGMLTVTEGGVAIDSDCRVLDESDQPIDGLFAAGGTGQGGMLLKGHGLHIAWALTSGRVAGESAARRQPWTSRTT
jgi:fumarate reductase flavoprotein subunit